MLGILALLMFLAVGMTSLIDFTWSNWQVMFVAVLVSISVFSWHGVTLAEAQTCSFSDARHGNRGCAFVWSIWWTCLTFALFAYT